MPPPPKTNNNLGENLSPGSNHYRAYIGPPKDYDLVAAMCFNLLTSAGLKEHHKVLDIGCGSLRTGRLLIPYLNEGNYTGVEPNQWLVDEGIKNEVGQSQIEIKKPVFIFSDSIDQLSTTDYDYAFAQSIFSHTGLDLTQKWLSEINSHLNNSGVLFCTFIITKSDTNKNGWIYPATVGYSENTIRRIANENGFICQKLDWSHPRQSWFAFQKLEYDARLVEGGKIIWNRNIKPMTRPSGY